ncbi:MAG: tetratricopeptide repeat protein [Gammaproteobacteria bacterium]|nr:tetratricopeptide repeat protein [Gammaproteobacteria bacterium]
MNKLFTTIILLCFSNFCNADWKKYESDSFVIISDERETSVRAWANELEVVKRLAELMFNTRISSSKESKLKIFIFNRRSDFRDLLGNSRVAGFYFQGVNQPYMMIGPRTQKEVLFHEFAHYLQSHSLGYQNPTWLEEGFAETMSTVLVDSDTVTFGGAPNRIGSLGPTGPISLESLLSDEYPTDRRKASAYYATAWITYKFIVLSDNEQLDAAFENYLKVYRSGERDLETLLESFAYPIEELDQTIRRTMRRPRGSVLELTYELPLSELGELNSKVVVTELTDKAFYTNLAAFHYAIGDYQEISQNLNPNNSRDYPLANAFYALARDVDLDYMENLVGINSPNLQDILSTYSQEEQSRYFSLISKYYYSRNIDASYEYAQQAIAIDNANVEALLTLCLISLRREEFNSAKTYIETATSYGFRNSEVIKTALATSLLVGEEKLLREATEQWKASFKHYENASDYSDRLSNLYALGTKFIRANPLENSPNNINIVGDLLDGTDRLGFSDLGGILLLSRVLEASITLVELHKDEVRSTQQSYENQFLEALKYLYGENGLKQDVDYKKAFDLLSSLREQGFAGPTYFLGIMHDAGLGVRKNTETAVSLFREAMQKEYINDYWEATVSPGLAYELARSYENGVLTDVDYERAYSLYKKSAVKGFTGAQGALGFLYESGRGVQQNLTFAYSWYSISATAEQSVLTQADLDDIAESLTSEQLAEASSIINQCIETNLKDCILVDQ